jgi:hypothetical protein
VKSGAFLTAGRIRAYALTLIAFYLRAIIAIVAIGKGNMDRLNRPTCVRNAPWSRLPASW